MVKWSQMNAGVVVTSRYCTSVLLCQGVIDKDGINSPHRTCTDDSIDEWWPCEHVPGVANDGVMVIGLQDGLRWW